MIWKKLNVSYIHKMTEGYDKLQLISCIRTQNIGAYIVDAIALIALKKIELIS